MVKGKLRVERPDFQVRIDDEPLLLPGSDRRYLTQKNSTNQKMNHSLTITPQ